MQYIVNRRIKITVSHPYYESSDCQYIQRMGFVVKNTKRCDCYI